MQGRVSPHLCLFPMLSGARSLCPQRPPPSPFCLHSGKEEGLPGCPLFPVFTCVIKDPESLKQQKSPSSIPFSLSCSSCLPLLSLSLFSEHPVVFFFRFSSSPGMNCKFVKNAVLIPKAFLVRCPLLCSLSVSPPKLGNLALLKT